MKSLRDRLQVTPALAPGEEVRGRHLANRAVNGLAVGGVLFATNHGLAFLPNRVEARLHREPWYCDWGDVVEVGTADRGPNPFSGAWRRRVEVTVADGHHELFVVRDARLVAQALRAMRSNAGRHD